MHIHIAKEACTFPSPGTDYFVSSPTSTSPDVQTPATPDHPLLAERPLTWLDVERIAVPIMDIGNVLNLQTQAAHGVARPQANPVQHAPAIRKVLPVSAASSSSATTSSSSSSYGSSPGTAAATRCTRCHRSISMDESDANAVSFGSHIYYCGTCTRLLESRG